MYISCRHLAAGSVLFPLFPHDVHEPCPPAAAAAAAAAAAQVAAADTALHLTGLTVSKYDNVVPPSVSLGNKATVSVITCYSIYCSGLMYNRPPG
jgi:hypothetical protein